MQCLLRLKTYFRSVCDTITCFRDRGIVLRSVSAFRGGWLPPLGWVGWVFQKAEPDDYSALLEGRERSEVVMPRHARSPKGNLLPEMRCGVSRYISGGLVAGRGHVALVKRPASALSPGWAFLARFPAFGGVIGVSRAGTMCSRRHHNRSRADPFRYTIHSSGWKRGVSGVACTMGLTRYAMPVTT